MLLMIDNYDSFTYNLVQYFAELGETLQVYRNDAITIEEIRRLKPERIVISPGPGRPEDAGITIDVIKNFSSTIPTLGVCLGHQAIGHAFGGKIVSAQRLMHGKTSMIHHADTGVFRGLPNPFEATRYHSLVVERASLPACMEVTAWTLDENGEFDEIMGLRHRQYAIEGVQFHPESILTRVGRELLGNFLGTHP